MRITICGSMRFFKEMKGAKQKLSELGHEVLTPPLLDFHNFKKELGDEKYFSMKQKFTRQHFDRIAKSDAILVLNYDKDGKQNYVGGNTFAEIAVAFHLNKKIFLLNPIPEYLQYTEEMVSMQPTVLNGERFEKISEKKG